MSSPLSNALIALKNAEMRRKRECIIMPASKLIGKVLDVIRREGFIGDIRYIDDGRYGKFKVQLLGRINDCKAIHPRLSIRLNELEEWEKRYLPARDIGILILTTPKGIITHKEAKALRIGGILLAYVW